MRQLCLAALLVLAAGASECEPASPRNLVASLDVTATLEHNQCGQEAVPAEQLLQFDAEVLRDGSDATWRRTGAEDLDGIFDDGTYIFATHMQQTLIEPDPTWGVEGCIVDEVQATEMQIVVEGVEDGGMAAPDAGTADAGVVEVPASMTGLHEIQLTPVPESYCVPVLTVAGGTFDALPCTVRYRLEGQGTAPVPASPSPDADVDAP